MIRISTALVALALLLSAPAAMAAGEAGDAGELPQSAQDLSGDGVVRIDGAFRDGFDIDMYELCLAGGGTFSASTVGGTEVDTQLYLFDSNGLGVYGNDDAEGGRQSSLPAGHARTPQAAGEYYLAVTPFNRDPRSPGGAIFPALGSVLAPTEAGASQPVNEWFGRAGGSGPYSITVTGTCRAADTTPPVVDLRSPLDGAVYLLDEPVAADYACADEQGGSGPAACAGTVPDGEPIDTSSVGEKSFAVEAADAAGNTATARSTYRVVYDFDGFLRPVRNRPQVNRWRAGLRVPLRFELGGDRGLDVVEDGWPQVAKVECGSGAEPQTGEPARHPRWFKELAYRKRKQRYMFLWKTDRKWSGSCRQFMLRLTDGTVRRADFEFVQRGRDPRG